MNFIMGPRSFILAIFKLLTSYPLEHSLLSKLCIKTPFTEAVPWKRYM